MEPAEYWRFLAWRAGPWLAVAAVFGALYLSIDFIPWLQWFLLATAAFSGATGAILFLSAPSREDTYSRPPG